MHIYICVYICTCVYVCVFMYVCTCVCVCSGEWFPEVPTSHFRSPCVPRGHGQVASAASPAAGWISRSFRRCRPRRLGCLGCLGTGVSHVNKAIVPSGNLTIREGIRENGDFMGFNGIS